MVKIFFAIPTELSSANNINLPYTTVYYILTFICFQINSEVYTKPIDAENLKLILKNLLEKQFGMEFGISATWLSCGSSLKNPLEKVLFFKKPSHESKSIVLDDTAYQYLYPMNE